MKTKYTISLVAIAAILGTTSFALAGDTSTFDASVSVLSPDQTGFIIGGQVAVNGVGTGALTLARSNASMLLTGSASSLLDRSTEAVGGNFGTTTLGDFGILDGVTSTAAITSSLAFDRSITTSGALVGLGAVTSRGEAIAALGSAGAASANTTTAGTRATGGYISGGTPSSTVTIDGGEGNASADASSQGSLNGSLSTSNTLQLLGTSGLFAGSNGMYVGEDNDAIAYGNSIVNADGTTGVALNSASVVVPTPATSGNLTGTGNGALFNVRSNLTSAAGSTTNTIDMTVANAGNGSISLTTSTGGFFTGGGAAAGSSSLADTTGSFFSPTFTTVTP